MMRSTFIARPAVDFDVLLQACDEVLDHKVTHGVDNTAKNLSNAERFLSILAATQDVEAPASLPPALLAHVSFSVLTVVDEIDILDILESCSGMSFTRAETKIRQVLLVILSGTIQQWRDAIVTGTNHSQLTIRAGFNQMHDLFVQEGLSAVWNDYEQKSQADGTYLLLEYKHH